MKAIDFIIKYSRINPGAVLGGYCLHKLLGIDYTDIDFYCRMPISAMCLSGKYVQTKIPLKRELKILNKYFILQGNEYAAVGGEGFVSYKCSDFSDGPVNIIMLVQDEPWISISSIVNRFDMSILRVGAWLDRKNTDLNIELSADHRLSVEKRIVVVRERAGDAEELRAKRLKKYKDRLPDYLFVRELI